MELRRSERLAARASLQEGPGSGTVQRRATGTHRKTTRKKKSTYFKKARSSPYFSSGTSLRPLMLSRRKKTPRHLLYRDYSPPSSPHDLVQERLWRNPWQLLVATILLNKTTGKQLTIMAPGITSCAVGKAALPVLWTFLSQYPSPEHAAGADWTDIAAMLAPLGLHNKRAQIIIRFSSE